MISVSLLVPYHYQVGYQGEHPLKTTSSGLSCSGSQWGGIRPLGKEATSSQALEASSSYVARQIQRTRPVSIPTFLAKFSAELARIGNTYQQNMDLSRLRGLK